MSRWRTVQEQLYQVWFENWIDGGQPATPYVFGNEKFDPPAAPWVRFSVQRLPGGAGTMGSPGNRKMERAGMVFIQLHEPPGDGVGRLSDLAERAAKIFENRRVDGQRLWFGEVEPGLAIDIEGGRWWYTLVEGRFDYEDIV